MSVPPSLRCRRGLPRRVRSHLLRSGPFAARRQQRAPPPTPRGRRWVPHAATAAGRVLAATDGHAAVYVAAARWLSGHGPRFRPRTRGLGIRAASSTVRPLALVVAAGAARASGARQNQFIVQS